MIYLWNLTCISIAIEFSGFVYSCWLSQRISVIIKHNIISVLKMTILRYFVSGILFVGGSKVLLFAGFKPCKLDWMCCISRIYYLVIVSPNCQFCSRKLSLSGYKSVAKCLKSGLLVIYSSHCSDVIMGGIVSQITSLTIVYSTVYPGAGQRKH